MVRFAPADRGWKRRGFAIYRLALILFAAGFLVNAAFAAQPGPKKTLEFKISRIRFEGVKIMPMADLERLARAIQFKKVTLARLKQFTAEIRQLYQSRGYLLARASVPPQKLKPGGDVRVLVSEGLYGKIKVEDNKHYTSRFVQNFFSKATRRGIVEETTLQRQLLLLNELPDITVRSLFLPGDAPGTSDVLLKVHDRTQFHLGLDYNNYGSPLVGRNRAGVALWMGHLIESGDEFTFRYTDPFPSNSDPLIQTGYSAPLGSSGNRVAYGFSSAATTVSGDLAALNIQGDAKIHSLSLQRPMERTLSRSSNLTTGLTFKDVQNFVLGNTRVSRDKLRELTASFDTNVVAGKTRTLASLLFTQGLGQLFGGHRNGDPESSRAGTGDEFTKFNLEAYHIRDLGKGRFVLGRFSGQASLKPLTVSEQFALGGPDSVRGFLQSDFLGDDGLTASVELRQLLFSSKNHKVNLQGVGFVDYGEASLIRPGNGERPARTFAGYGGGIRASFGRTTTLRLDLGLPVTDKNSIDTKSVLYAQVASKF